MDRSRYVLNFMLRDPFVILFTTQNFEVSTRWFLYSFTSTALTSCSFHLPNHLPPFPSYRQVQQQAKAQQLFGGHHAHSGANAKSWEHFQAHRTVFGVIGFCDGQKNANVIKTYETWNQEISNLYVRYQVDGMRFFGILRV